MDCWIVVYLVIVLYFLEFVGENVLCEFFDEFDIFNVLFDCLFGFCGCDGVWDWIVGDWDDLFVVDCDLMDVGCEVM